MLPWVEEQVTSGADVVCGLTHFGYLLKNKIEFIIDRGEQIHVRLSVWFPSLLQRSGDFGSQKAANNKSIT